MEISQLRSLVQVAAVGSVTRGAEGLFLSQPAVSQQIRALEEEIGMPLFERTGRGVRLTPAGVALRDYAARCLGLLDEAREVLGDMKAAASGHLILGAGVTTSIFRLPAWLRAFRSNYPVVEVVVRTGRSSEIAAMAIAREVDLGLVTSPVEHPALQVTSLFREEIVCVAHASERASDPGALPLILFPQGTGFREYLDAALTGAGIRPSVKMETDSVEAIKSFVAVGLGASFLPLSAVEGELASGVLTRISTDSLPTLIRSTSVIYRRDRYLSKAARAFLDVLAAAGPSDHDHKTDQIRPPSPPPEPVA